MRFTATLDLHGKTATGLDVPAGVVEALGAGKRPPVHVTINGHTWRSTIAAYRGDYFLGVSAENRAGAGIAAGDRVDVDVALDTEPRTVDVPPDLDAALAADAPARAAFDALSDSNRNGFVQQLTGAKTDATRRRRLDRIVAELRAGGSG
jgi:hypothetical protein